MLWFTEIIVMSLISLNFILFTIALLILYYTIGRRFQWVLLLIASIVFYLCGDWHDLLYLGTTIIIQYICALFLDRENIAFQKEVKEKNLKGKEKTKCKEKYAHVKRRYLIISVVITIGILCYVKYTNFVIENINSLLSRFENAQRIDSLEILIPLGISFYTFQSLGYVIDVYKGRINAEKNICKLALFVSFFPTITQGPILRFEEVKDSLFSSHPFYYKSFVFGLERMLYGYLKKLVIAERLNLLSNAIISNYEANHYPGLIIFFGVFFMGLRTYMDFSGGMDIVIGLSESLGIILPENFRRPYLARAYSDFWKRWHISLGAWFERYVFYPISLSKAFNKLGKKSRTILGERKGKALAPSLASFIVFTIIGIWHGAAWRYVVFGLWQAVFVAQKSLMEDTYEKMRIRFHVNVESKAFIFFQIMRTIFFVTLGKYFLATEFVSNALKMMKNTFTSHSWQGVNKAFLSTLGIRNVDFGIMLFFTILVLAVDILNEKNIVIREFLYKKCFIIRWIVLYIGLFTVLLFGLYGPGYDTSAFIYQRF